MGVNRYWAGYVLAVSAIVGGAIAVAAASIPATASAALRPGTPAACPSVDPMVPVTIEQAVAAGRRLVSQNVGAFLGKRSAPIGVSAVASLDGSEPLTGIARWRDLVLKRCGRVVAQEAWLIQFYLVDTKIARVSPFNAVVVHGRYGWRLWYTQ